MARNSRRYYRTLLLGMAAMGTMVWFAVKEFDIPWPYMRDLLLTTVLVVAVVIVVAGLAAALWIGLRKLLQKP